VVRQPHSKRQQLSQVDAVFVRSDDFGKGHGSQAMGFRRGVTAPTFVGDEQIATVRARRGNGSSRSIIASTDVDVKGLSGGIRKLHG
jgi:hypothetical protein